MRAAWPLGCVSFPGEKAPWGSDCVPPAGDGVGTQIEPINGVKAKINVVLSALSVGSEIRFPALPCSELGGVCHLPVSLIKIGGPFLFIVDLAKGVIVWTFTERLQVKRLHVRMRDWRRDANL